MPRELAGGRWIRGHHIVRPADDPEPATVAAEKLFEVLKACNAGLKRGTRRDDAKLAGVWRETKSIEERTQQIRNFCPRRAAVRMEFVHHEMEYVAWRRVQPCAGLVEDGGLDRPH